MLRPRLSPSMMCLPEWEDARTALEAMVTNGVEMLHADVMDGSFVPNLMLGTESVKHLRKISPVPLDLHLMIERPEDKLSWFDPQPGEQVAVQLTNLLPAVTAEELERTMFGEELFVTSSRYEINANRTNNLRLACEAINGTVLNPGDVFSFNDIVGERTDVKGYLGATVYAGNGASETQLGGGVCQVASTIYYATLHLNMEQVEREPHMYAVSYVPMGMDATVYWGSIDYRFRNTLSNPVKILAWLEDGHVHITFLGVKETDNTVKMSYSVIETIDWEEVEEVDETREPGFRQEVQSPYTGYKVVTYKAVYDADGNRLSYEQEAFSNYKKRDKKFVVGPAKAETPPEEEPPNPDDPFDTDNPFDTEEPSVNPENPGETPPETPGSPPPAEP